MTRRILLLLICCCCASCGRGKEPSESYARALQDFRQGDFRQALERAHGPAPWTVDPHAEWHWPFRLLEAEVLLAMGKARDAQQIVDAPGVPDRDAAALE